jgi:hypothetical protein
MNRKEYNRKWMRAKYHKPDSAEYRARLIAYAKAYYLRRKKEPKWNAARLKKLREAASQRRKNPEYRVRINSRQRQYLLLKWLATRGWTLKDYQRLRRAGCPLCGTKKHLVKDHNHKTGRARGLLCNNCNRMLGWYEARRQKIEAYVAS